MAFEPLHVDPERLAAAASRLLAAAGEIPAPPTPGPVSGSDPLSQGIAAQAGKLETPISEGMPAVQKATTEAAENVGTAARAYESTDRRLGDDISKRTFPDRFGKHGKAQMVDHTWKQEPQPGPVDPRNMTEAQARAAWTAVNNDIAQNNTRCGLTFTLPAEGAAYNACVADRGPLLERQAESVPA
jgi:hypothetical protein